MRSGHAIAGGDIPIGIVMLEPASIAKKPGCGNRGKQTVRFPMFPQPVLLL